MTDNWVWDGGRPCLDFVNTRRDRWTDGWELLLAPADLGAWLMAAGLASRPRITRRELGDAIELREAIDRTVRAATPAAADVAVLNRWARERPAPQLRVGRDGARSIATDRSVASVLGELAIDAIELLTSIDALVRVCALDSCGLRFVDRSPAHNRQWCSMTRCGNRAKARLHYARRRAAAQVEDNRHRE